MDAPFGENREHYLLCRGQRVRTHPLGRVDNGKSADIDYVRSPCKLLTWFVNIESSAEITYSVRECDQLMMVLVHVDHSFFIKIDTFKSKLPKVIIPSHSCSTWS
jgi:hypothetical protein